MTIKNTLAAVTAIALGCALAAPASAELFTDPIGKSAVGKITGTGFFGTSTVDYEDEFGNNADVDRTFLGVSGAYGVNSALDMFGSFALITEAESEDFPNDGDGNAIAFGVRGVLPFQGNAKLHGYAQYLIIDEDYGNFVGNKVRGEETSLSAGIVAAKQVDTITLYGEPELILTSSGSAKIGTTKYDADRDDTLGFRVGARFKAANTMDVNFGLALMHESGFMLSLSSSL
jgi:hypothetical protein